MILYTTATHLFIYFCLFLSEAEEAASTIKEHT